MKQPRPARASPRTRFALGVAALILLAAAAIPGISRLSVGYLLSDQFPPWSRQSQEIAWIERMYRGSEELILEIDSGKEFGLSDPVVFRKLAGFCETAQRIAGVSRVVSYVDVVKEIEMRLGGPASVNDPFPPASLGEAAIAEDMELALSFSGGGGVGLFSDGASRRARVSIGLAASASRPPALEVSGMLSAELDRLGFAGAYRWGGRSISQAYQDTSFARGQLVSFAVLMALFAVLLSAVLGSWRKGLAALLAPAVGILAALGLTGILGWRLNQVNILSIAAVAGMGVDGAIMCLMIESNPATRGAIRDATVLVAGTMIALVPSSFYHVFQTVAACALGLAAAAFAVLFILDPARGLPRKIPRKIPRRGGA